MKGRIRRLRSIEVVVKAIWTHSTGASTTRRITAAVRSDARMPASTALKGSRR